MKSEAGRVAFSLLALLASAPLLAQPGQSGALSTALGWTLLAVSLLLPLGSRIVSLFSRRR